jgi:predicted ATPase
MIGDLDLADRYTAMLHEQTKAHSLDVWHTYADGFAGEIMVRRGDIAAGLDRLRGAIKTLAQAGFLLYQTSFLASLTQGLLGFGQIPEALAAVDRAIGQCDRTGEAWLLAELLRIRGEIQLRGRNPEDGEASLLRSIELARSQGALAWELRTAASLSRLWHRTSRSTTARALISTVLAKFTEGLATPDYRAATALLAEIDKTAS